MLVTGTLVAQQPIDLVLKLDHMADGTQEKLVYESLYGIDPTLELRYDPTGPEFHLISEAGIPADTYAQAVERIMQDNVVSVYDQHANRIEEAQVPLDGFPRYIRTGDVAKDDHDYEQRKQDWIAIHKTIYSRYQEAQRTGKD